MKQGSRVWNPAKSPLTVEFSAELLRQVRKEGSAEKSRRSYGKRADSQVRC